MRQDQNRHTVRRSNSAYVHGTAVPKELPQERPLRRKQPTRRKASQVSRRVQKNREKIHGMSFSYVLFLMTAAAAIVYMCVGYLNTQSEITGMTKEIRILEQELDAVNTENNSLDYEINAYKDLDYIYRIATQELGMVPVTKDQISLYDRTEKEFVIQSGDIPDAS